MEELEVNRERHDESAENGSPTKRTFRERIKVCRRDAGPGNCGGLDVIRV